MFGRVWCRNESTAALVMVTAATVQLCADYRAAARGAAEAAAAHGC